MSESDKVPARMSVIMSEVYNLFNMKSPPAFSTVIWLLDHIYNWIPGTHSPQTCKVPQGKKTNNVQAKSENICFFTIYPPPPTSPLNIYYILQALDPSCFRIWSYRAGVDMGKYMKAYLDFERGGGSAPYDQIEY